MREYCLKCGALIPEGAGFCQMCGAGADVSDGNGGLDVGVYAEDHAAGTNGGDGPLYDTVSMGGEIASSDYPIGQHASSVIADDNPTTVLQSLPVAYLIRHSTGEKITFEAPAFIGKGSASTCRIGDNSAISRVHVGIGENEGVLSITDRGSTNGTWVDGVRLHAGEIRELREGAVITLANEDFTFGTAETD